MGLVVPAVLPTSRDDLQKKLELLSQVQSITRVQIDTVDGRFVSPASWPYTADTEFRDMVKRGEMLPNLNRIEYEIDLMCFDADRAAGGWLALGASRLTFHVGSTVDLPRFLASARKRYGGGGALSPLVSFGIALSIAGDLALVEPCLEQIDYVQFMGIARIGMQRQPFDRRVLEKVRIFRERHPEIAVQVDGGVSLGTAQELLTLGVRDLVIGSAILRAASPATAIAAFETLQTAAAREVY